MQAIAGNGATAPARGRRALALLWILCGAAALGWAIAHAWIGDDIYITFRYCDNVLMRIVRNGSGRIWVEVSGVRSLELRSRA